MRSVAPALALGNAVLLKPDPQTPISGGIVVARIFEEAGLPAGLLSVLPGGADVGEALVAAPQVRMVTFTGSTDTGRRVGAVAGETLKRVALELGGKNSVVVLDDADIDAAVGCGAFGSFHHQGQICMATGRHIVHESIVTAYARALAERAASLRVGDPSSDDVALGPIINGRQLARIEAIVAQSVAAGAKLLVGGRREGPYYFPTVLVDVHSGMPAFEEEIFGPVAVVVSAKSDQHAIELANMTSYGLSGAVMSRSFDRARAVAQKLRVGMVHINDQTINDEARVPMGGRGQSGNGSRFGVVNNLEEFTEYQWVTVRSAPPKY
jgi:benzaldehyde dehydrogenase (NAD)